MEKKEEIEISVLKGEKLFNENTPFVINVSSKDPVMNYIRCKTDLICVIDNSSSMKGSKIFQVKESLKILIDLMEQDDRIALILFNKRAILFFDLQNLTKNNKEKLKQKIDTIETNRGTNISSGLQFAVDILKFEKENNISQSRVSSVILLSDGCDSKYNDVELADSLKGMTKGFELNFTLHTFGYGHNYDEKVMNKLANLRDGSFFYVEEYNKVTEYFICVLGGCISVISKKADLKVKLLKNNCKIVKIFGSDNLYKYDLKDDIFETTMLQIISGKEYSYVLEIKIDDNNIKIGDEILDINFKYENNNDTINKNIKYNYELKSINYMKANEEYIRSQVYSVIEEVMILKEKGEKSLAKQKLNEIKICLLNKYKGNNPDYLKDIEKSYEIFKDDESLVRKSAKYLSSQIIQNQSKKQGSNMTYCNSIQLNLIKSISNPSKLQLSKPSISIKNNNIDLRKSANLSLALKNMKFKFK